MEAGPWQLCTAGTAAQTVRWATHRDARVRCAVQVCGVDEEKGVEEPAWERQSSPGRVAWAGHQQPPPRQRSVAGIGEAWARAAAMHISASRKRGASRLGVARRAKQRRRVQVRTSAPAAGQTSQRGSACVARVGGRACRPQSVTRPGSGQPRAARTEAIARMLCPLRCGVAGSRKGMQTGPRQAAGCHSAHGQ